MKAIKQCVKWQYYCPKCRSLLFRLIKCPSCGQEVEYEEDER